MTEEVKEKEDFNDLRIPQKINFAVKTRLELMTPYIEKWPQAMALGLKPQNLTTTLGQLHSISDEIWYLAGDKSKDYNWYTKRALLTNVYVLTETFMITDKSENFQATWEFLDRRVEDTSKLGKKIRESKGIAAMASQGISSIIGIVKPSNLSMDDSEMLRQQEELLKNRK